VIRQSSLQPRCVRPRTSARGANVSIARWLATSSAASRCKARLAAARPSAARSDVLRVVPDLSVRLMIRSPPGVARWRRRRATRSPRRATADLRDAHRQGGYVSDKRRLVPHQPLEDALPARAPSPVGKATPAGIKPALRGVSPREQFEHLRSQERAVRSTPRSARMTTCRIRARWIYVVSLTFLVRLICLGAARASCFLAPLRFSSRDPGPIAAVSRPRDVRARRRQLLRSAFFDQ